jgi:hypothetical protein
MINRHYTRFDLESISLLQGRLVKEKPRGVELPVALVANPPGPLGARSIDIDKMGRTRRANSVAA